MIKFFRRIRQKLLTENKFSKYLIYAIGEITLVVIGILIALQVNNWNENRKERQQEDKKLQEFHDALKSDLKDIRFNIEWHKSAKTSCEILLNAFDKKLPYHDSLATHFGQMARISQFLPSIGVYESLKSKGIELIKNDSLRRKISSYYEQDIKFQIGWENFNRSQNPYYTEMMNKHFNVIKLVSYAVPKDYESLRDDDVFKSWLYHTISWREVEIDAFHWTEQNAVILSNLIENELEK